MPYNFLFLVWMVVSTIILQVKVFLDMALMVVNTMAVITCKYSQIIINHTILHSPTVTYIVASLFVCMDRSISVVCAIIILSIRVPLWVTDCMLRSSQGHCRYCRWLTIIRWRIFSCDVTTGEVII